MAELGHPIGQALPPAPGTPSPLLGAPAEVGSSKGFSKGPSKAQGLPNPLPGLR